MAETSDSGGYLPFPLNVPFIGGSLFGFGKSESGPIYAPQDPTAIDIERLGLEQWVIEHGAPTGVPTAIRIPGVTPYTPMISSPSLEDVVRATYIAQEETAAGALGHRIGVAGILGGGAFDSYQRAKRSVGRIGLGLLKRYAPKIANIIGGATPLGRAALLLLKYGPEVSAALGGAYFGLRRRQIEKSKVQSRYIKPGGRLTELGKLYKLQAIQRGYALGKLNKSGSLRKASTKAPKLGSFVRRGPSFRRVYPATFPTADNLARSGNYGSTAAARARATQHISAKNGSKKSLGSASQGKFIPKEITVRVQKLSVPGAAPTPVLIGAPPPPPGPTTSGPSPFAIAFGGLFRTLGQTAIQALFRPRVRRARTAPRTVPGTSASPRTVRLSIGSARKRKRKPKKVLKHKRHKRRSVKRSRNKRLSTSLSQLWL